MMSPEAVVSEAFLALEEERWADFVAFIDPAHVQHFRDEQIRWRKQRQQRPRMTAADIRRHQPDMPEAVAEYQAEQVRKHQERYERISAEFDGVESEEELERLSAPEMLIRHVRAMSPRAKLIAAFEAEGQTVPEDEALDVRDFGPRRQVIGAVHEGDSLAHVLYRGLVGGAPEGEAAGPLEVATVRRTPEGWRLMLDHGLFGLQSWTVISAGREHPPL